jgi:hypothetical protein
MLPRNKWWVNSRGMTVKINKKPKMKNKAHIPKVKGVKIAAAACDIPENSDKKVVEVSYPDAMK